MIVKNPIGLIGDVLGTFPVLQELNSRKENFSVVINEEVKELYDLIPEVHVCDCKKADRSLDVNAAFTLAHQHGLYMSQAFYPFMGLPIPEQPVKAELTIQEIDVPVYDYVIAPFGRSAPDDQKWSMDKWLALINSMPDYTFAILGNSKYDDWSAPVPKNLTLAFNWSFMEVANVLKKSKFGCISIVTGISHFCFHLDVKNYLLTNQTGMTWGENPEAICLREPIPTLQVKTVYDLLSQER